MDDFALEHVYTYVPIFCISDTTLVCCSRSLDHRQQHGKTLHGVLDVPIFLYHDVDASLQHTHIQHAAAVALGADGQRPSPVTGLRAPVGL